MLNQLIKQWLQCQSKKWADMGTFKTVRDAAYNRRRLILYRFGNLVRLLYEAALYFNPHRTLFKSTHIGSLFWLTLQSFGINKMRKITSKDYFAISFNRLSCQFAEKWATQFWAFFFSFLRNIKFISKKSLDYELECLINWFNTIWWQK